MAARRMRWVLFSVNVAAWLGAACGRRIEKFAQTDDFTYRVTLSGGAVTASGRYRADSSAAGWRGLGWFPDARFVWPSPASRLHPDLLPLLHASASDSSGVWVVVGLQDRSIVPRLPIERIGLRRDSATVVQGIAAIDSARTALRTDRARFYPRQVQWLEQNVGAVTGLHFELTQAVVARVPRNRFKQLASWGEVTQVRPLRALGPPPQPPPPPKPPSPSSIQGAATDMGLDKFQLGGWTVGRVRLLDTGVDDSHSWFAGVPRVVPLLGGPALVLHDCIGTTLCDGSETEDCDLSGHGTQVAAILVARPPAPVESEGVTEAVLHSCRVYWRDGTGYMWHDADAIEAALNTSFVLRADVALVEVSDKEGPDGVIAGSADGAFASGIAVIAPIGNGGAWQADKPYTGSQSPGNARGVLGIGAREAADHAIDYVLQSWGNVPDRQKPDLQALTSTLSAGPSQSTATLPATSGAAPYAAAAAMALRGLLGATGAAVDPGQVYAAMIACGERVREPKGSFCAVRGAGLLFLPPTGDWWTGAVDLQTFGDLDRNVVVALPGASSIEVGLWWPDPRPGKTWPGLIVETHYDFDLELYDPTGVCVQTSGGDFGVFERIQFKRPNDMPIEPGTWRVHIVARSVGFAQERAYWAAFVAR